MHHSAWISLAFVALLPSSALALDASGLPPRTSGATTSDRPITGQPDPRGQLGDMCATAPGGSVCRPLSDRASDALNVKDKGAKLDGTLDTTAFQTARAAAPRNGVVLVPPGCINANVPVDASKTVLWQLSGNVYCGGTAPVSGIGSDTVETFLPDNGGKFISATATTANSKALTTFQRTVTHPTGTGVLDTLRVNTEVRTNSVGFFNFGLTSAMSDFTPGSNPGGNNVAIYGQYNRETGNVPGWSMALETNDRTNTVSSQNGGTLGAEILLRANRADDGNRRIVLDLAQGKALPHNAQDKGTYEESEIYAFVRSGNVFGRASEGHAKLGYAMEGPISEAAFDASKATFVDANAIAYRLKADSKIAFNAGGTRTMQWNTGGALQYLANTAILLEIKDNGTVNVPGPLRAGGLNIPDQGAPTSSTDPVGAFGDVRFAGQYMYRKTSSGWLRFTGSKF